MAEEKKQNRGMMKKILLIAGRVAFILAIMFLIVYMVTVLTSSNDFFISSAERESLVRFDENLVKAEALADEHYENLYAVADRIRTEGSREAVADVMKEYIGSPLFGDLRFYHDGVAYSATGAPVDEEMSGNQELSSLAAANRAGCSAVYFDKMMKLNCMAFFVPVRGAYADGVLSIVPLREQTDNTSVFKHIIDADELLSDGMSLSLVIDKNGSVWASAARDDFNESIGNNFFTLISNISNKEASNLVNSHVAKGERTVCSIDALGTAYVVAISPIDAFEGKLSLVSVSMSGDLVAPEMAYIRHIINLIVIAIISLVIGFIYAIFYYRETQRALVIANYEDPTIGCPNAEQFRALAEHAISERQKKYSIAVFYIRRFNYIRENLEADELNEALKYVAKVMETFCNVREAYGYLGDGKFAMLITHVSDRSIIDRIRLIETVVSKNEILGGKAKKLFDIGVAHAFGARKSTVGELISYAGIACEGAKTDINKSYVLYSGQVSMERERDEKIEAEMESALAAGEFRLFLQPKYNVVGDRIDSAEALVRWFDTKTGDYRFPSEFISLFESNGFITKLDHFMYIETLKCLSTAAERGERVVPISVNVSLVTASAPDFLDFYIENKKKYRIGDDFIIIEFTESFAMGDYGKIRNIVTTLHRNGIRCSLDDFGTGYASFNVLKHIPIDELKLDRVFLTRGYSDRIDATLLETVISLAKSLGIRVVQEGVETKEMFDFVVSKGCDVVQGYYYAKAIPAEEYRLFIGSNTSIKYKSLVK